MSRTGRRGAKAVGGASGSNPRGLDDSFAHLRALGDRNVQAGRLLEAENQYRQALVLQPDDVPVLHSLGNVLLDLARPVDAAAVYRHVLAIQPHHVDVLINLGEAHHAAGQPDQAIAVWREAQTTNPRHPLPAMNLGIALIQRGEYDQAIANFQRACELASDSAEAHTNLARAYITGGDITAALEAIWRALSLRETQDAKAVFAAVLRRFRFVGDMPELRSVAARAISEAWARPDDISGAAIGLAKQSPPLAQAITRAAAAWPERLVGEALWTATQRSAIGSDPLLKALMQSAPVCDFDVERFFVSARQDLLERALDGSEDPALVEFHCALARQCFINEYVYAIEENEAAQAQHLRRLVETAIESGADLPALMLVALAAYYPLHALAGANTLSARRWPEPVSVLLMQQVMEPLHEAKIRDQIPVLTEIDDRVSLAVKEQYEANPYPRWTKTSSGIVPQTVAQTFRMLFPWSAVKFADCSSDYDVLIAGCGTGQQSIETAQRYRGVHVLATDLSRTSLGYAIRKTRELGINAIEYVQADILKLGSIGRTFDVIESGGVLHHLADPFVGWRILISLLRPGGFMYVGLYSASGRSHIVKARALIAMRGYRGTLEDIRRFRHEIAAEAGGSDLRQLLRSPDFYSTSGCRDLCFHVQEHHLTLPQIKAFLTDNDLEFLGFVLDADTVTRFQKRFPGRDADLDCWEAFEIENPGVFANLYNFWVRKAE